MSVIFDTVFVLCVLFGEYVSVVCVWCFVVYFVLTHICKDFCIAVFVYVYACSRLYIHTYTCEFFWLYPAETLSADELGPPVCVKRRYLMVYVPSGFWSRLITRIMINLKRTGLVDPNHRRSYGDAVYWRRGIFVSFNGGKFLVKSIEVQ